MPSYPTGSVQTVGIDIPNPGGPADFYYVHQNGDNLLTGGYTWQPVWVENDHQTVWWNWVKTQVCYPNTYWSELGVIGCPHWWIIIEGHDWNTSSGTYWMPTGNGTSGGSGYGDIPNPDDDWSSDKPNSQPAPYVAPPPPKVYISVPARKNIFLNGVSLTLTSDVYSVPTTLPVDLIIGDCEGVLGLDEFKIGLIGGHTANYTPSTVEFTGNDFFDDSISDSFSEDTVEVFVDNFVVDVTTYFGSSVFTEFTCDLITEITIDVAEVFSQRDSMTWEVSGGNFREMLEQSASSNTVALFSDTHVEDTPASSVGGSDTVLYSISADTDDGVEEANAPTDTVSYATTFDTVDVEISSTPISTYSVANGYRLDVNDTSHSVDSFPVPTWFHSVSDALSLKDSIVYKIGFAVADSMALSDTAANVLHVFLTEYLALLESHIVNMNTSRTINDGFAMVDSPHITLGLTISDAMAMSDTVTVKLILSILETLGFTELVTQIGQLNNSVSDPLLLLDEVKWGYNQIINDAMAMVDLGTVIGKIVNSVSESLTVADTVSGKSTATIPMAESLTLSDTVSSRGVLYNVIYDTLAMDLTVEISGEVWECYVLNTPKFLPSVYSGFSFNSYSVFENRAYGLKSVGLYELTGDTDAGVAFHTGVQLSETVFGMPNQKRFRKAYIGVSGDTPLMVMETEAGVSKAYTIDADGEVDASRALRSKKWKLTIVDFDTLDTVNLIPVVLSK